MLRDLVSIRVKNDFFNLGQNFSFFSSNNKSFIKGSLVYGRNGSGKSTIARAFRQVADGGSNSNMDVKVFDSSGVEIVLSEEDRKKIYVFDETYVDKNVKLQDDKLETIVMLGEAVTLTESIEKAKRECNRYEQEYEEKSAQVAELKDEKKVKSPMYYKKIMVDELKGDGHWAGRSREINGWRKNASVTDDTYKEFLSINITRSESDLNSEYKAKLEELNSARMGGLVIKDEIPAIKMSFNKAREDGIISLLEKKIEKPLLSDREKRLLSCLENRGMGDLSERLRFFKDKDNTECPYCLQALSVKYKESLVGSIQKILNKEVEAHLEELRRNVLSLIYLDLSLFGKIPGCNECVGLLDRLNAGFERYNEYLDNKIKDPYSPISIKSLGLSDLFDRLVVKLRELEQNRKKYNEKKTQVDPIIKVLNDINAELAAHKIKPIAELYEQHMKLFAEECDELERKRKKLDEQKHLIMDLEAKRRNVAIAVDSINSCLRYILFAEDRLRIENSDGGYKLLVNGKNVRPCDISEGERNIIGLSYFFTKLFEGKAEVSAFKDEYLIVIDDPISSFDFENRVGVFSFLNYKLTAFLTAQKLTRVLLLTHELRTFYEINKMFDSILKECKDKFKTKGLDIRYFEIRDKSLNVFLLRGCKRHEYTELISIIYQYAKGELNAYNTVIGNVMRQVMEAFGTFLYKEGIVEISKNEKILKLLNDNEYIAYYRNLMYRLVLHGGSHKEEQVLAMDDFDFFNYISDEEKLRTAKDVLCFIYLLNRVHVLQHLKKYSSAESDLDAWCCEIKSKSVAL